MKTLTKQRLLKIADAIEAAPADRFDMRTFLSVQGNEELDAESPALAKKLTTSCGTSGCIAGWTVAVFPRAGRPDADRFYDIQDHAARILDLDTDEVADLFHSGWQMNARKAAERLRRAAEEGEIREVGLRGGRLP